jgi:uncharacterized protein (TIGR02147 family)
MLRSVSSRRSAEASTGSPEVFAYLDYRAFLRASYEARRPRLSHRGLARRAGIRSPSFLGHVMDGKRGLKPDTAARVGEAFGLAGDARAYFVALVAFNQADGALERRRLYRRLLRFRRFQEVQPLHAARDAYHSRWYLPAIRELSLTPAFRDDAAHVARLLDPPITERQARGALRTLQRLGLLARDESGALRATSAQVTTEPETASVRIATFHRAMMERASVAIDRVPPADREISSITLSVDAAGLSELKERIQEFRRELLDDFDAPEGAERVVQLNFQLFPLSVPLPGGRP